MCLCTPSKRTPCCGSEECHRLMAEKTKSTECPWHKKKEGKVEKEPELVTSLRAKVEALKKDYDRVSRLAADQAATIVGLEAALVAATTKADTNETRAQQAEQLAWEANQKLVETQARLTELEKKLEENEKEIRRVQDTWEQDLDAAHTDLTARLEAAEKEKHYAEIRFEEALDRMDLLRQEHDETRGYRQHAEYLLAEAQREIASLEAALQKTLQERDLAIRNLVAMNETGVAPDLMRAKVLEDALNDVSKNMRELLSSMAQEQEPEGLEIVAALADKE